MIEITKGLKSSYDTHTIIQAQSDILKQLLAIQFEQWEKTESEYELQEINRGKFVYSLNNFQQSMMQTHWLCPQCKFSIQHYFEIPQP